mmetsp:Transcript_6474/g.25093  ORF Transcript_6474/g.25093 Transcript_6474/m.25093 type:complete len:215 (-) Transcript_6474:649-1293(-)
MCCRGGHAFGASHCSPDIAAVVCRPPRQRSSRGPISSLRSKSKRSFSAEPAGASSYSPAQAATTHAAVAGPRTSGAGGSPRVHRSRKSDESWSNSRALMPLPKSRALSRIAWATEPSSGLPACSMTCSTIVASAWSDLKSIAFRSMGTTDSTSVDAKLNAVPEPACLGWVQRLLKSQPLSAALRKFRQSMRALASAPWTPSASSAIPAVATSSR